MSEEQIQQIIDKLSATPLPETNEEIDRHFDELGYWYSLLDEAENETTAAN